VALLTYIRETIYIIISRLGAKTQKRIYDFGTITFDTLPHATRIKEYRLTDQQIYAKEMA